MSCLHGRKSTVTECLTAMLQWLLEAKQISWADVVQTLVDVDRRNIARDICSRYGVPFPVGKDELEKGVKTKRKSQMLANMEEPELKNQRVADAKASSDEVRGDLEKIMKEEYPALKGRVAELTRQKEELAEKFRFEREEHEVLLNYRREQSRKSDQKVSSLERMIEEKERSLEELQRKLNKSELEYQETRQRLSDLTKELTERTSELERKSSALRELEETQQEEEWELQAKRKMRDNELRRQTARGVSQSEYITEIKIQLATAEKKVEDYSQQIENIRLDLPRKEKEITIVSESLQKKRNLLREKTSLQPTQSTGEADQTDEIELQIDITKQNIKLVDLRSENMLTKTTLQTIQRDLEQSMQSVRLNKNMLPDLDKCRIEGLNLSVHKTMSNLPIKVKVHLCDRDGEPCTGEHVVTARKTSGSQELYFEEHDGEHTLKYTPKPGEQYLSVFVNDDLLNSEPLHISYNNTPHIPNCTVSGDGLKEAKKNFVASFQVHLVDEDGDTVLSEPSMSASLSQNGVDCLVLPPDVATTETPGVYVVSYLPGQPGDCELTVLVNGQPIGEGKFVVNVEQSNNYTPLIGAAESGHHKFVVKLLEEGADVNEKDEYGNTALHDASRRGHTATVDLLLLKGAQVNSLNNDSRTPLILAADYGHTSTVETLINEGAIVSAKDEYGNTALHRASCWGHTATVDLLLLKGAQVDSQNNGSDTALDIARLNGHTEVCKILAELYP